MEGFDHAAALVGELAVSDEDVVAGARRLLERTYYGKDVAEIWPERHDYLVAVPTKQENLRRIENVFAVLSGRARIDVVNLLRRSCWRYGAGDSQES